MMRNKPNPTRKPGPRARRPIRAIALCMALAWTGAAGAQSMELHAVLDGAHVVSATESPGTGEAHAWLGADDRVRIEFVFGGLADGATGAGLYQGRATENGNRIVEFDLAPGATRARLDGIEVVLTPDDAARMRAGETYVQVATSGYPDGAIRGQLLPQPVRLEDGVEPEETD